MMLVARELHVRLLLAGHILGRSQRFQWSNRVTELAIRSASKVIDQSKVRLLSDLGRVRLIGTSWRLSLTGGKGRIDC